MDSTQFTAGLMDEMHKLFAQLGEHETLESESQGNVQVVPLLKAALKSELEASELAGLWLPSTPEVDVKITFGQLCGDEMKHYKLIAQRLESLGEDLSDFDPMAEGYSPLYQYLRGLRTTVERIAGGPFAREAIAEIRNAQFIAFCRAVGDTVTAELYENTIHPEEIHHHRVGRKLLEHYATTPEQQAMAADAARNTLAIADELRTLAEKTKGLHSIPVS